jgi:ankyrin repeat protein
MRKEEQLVASCYGGDSDQYLNDSYLDIDVNRRCVYKGSDFTILHAACHTGKTTVVAWLLRNFKSTIDVNEKIGDSTPLMLACCWDYYEIVEMLAAHSRIDLNITDSQGYTALRWAKERNYARCVHAIMRK